MSAEQLAFYQRKLEYETDSWDLNAALEGGQHVVVVDGRSAEAYAKEHIPGAISIPHRTISRESLAGLDRAALYVTYCDGIGCNASTRTALKMLELGFRVKELLGGLDWWKRDGHATASNASPLAGEEAAPAAGGGPLKTDSPLPPSDPPSPPQEIRTPPPRFPGDPGSGPRPDLLPRQGGGI